MPLPCRAFFHGHAIAQLDHSQVCAVCGHHRKSTIEELLSAFLGALGKKTKLSLKSVVSFETYLRYQQYESDVFNAAGQPPVCALHNGHEYAPKSLIDLHIESMH